MIETQELEHPQTQPRKRLTSKQVKWLVGGLLIALTVGYLIFSAASGSASYYVTIDELQHMELSRRNVRVAGYVIGDSIVWEARDLRLAFEMEDESGRLAVRYKGPRPDMFRDQAEVVVEGKLASDGVFEARTMLLKCPSKYEEAD
jgi:cytochrome c-type biogenesis protein CcmE